jgi:hypothetical protein
MSRKPGLRERKRDSGTASRLHYRVRIEDVICVGKET